MERKILNLFIFCSGFLFIFLGCTLNKNNGLSNIGLYAFPSEEPNWIKNGEPIIFEGRSWFPQDQVDILLDEEVLPLGDYQDVKFFAAKVDVRPYERLYTKFGPNKYRVFEQEPRE